MVFDAVEGEPKTNQSSDVTSPAVQDGLACSKTEDHTRAAAWRLRGDSVVVNVKKYSSGRLPDDITWRVPCEDGEEFHRRRRA